MAGELAHMDWRTEVNGLYMFFGHVQGFGRINVAFYMPMLLALVRAMSGHVLLSTD